jgi:hypothetical protein
MKISLALGSRHPLSPQTAWGCLTTNLALPGFGSLMAGRTTGYVQGLLGVGGLVLTMVFGLRFIVWYFANWARIQDPGDSFEMLHDLWLALRWALAGMAIFAAAWLWALFTSIAIVRDAKRAEARRVPPRLD